MSIGFNMIDKRHTLIVYVMLVKIGQFSVITALLRVNEVCGNFCLRFKMSKLTLHLNQSSWHPPFPHTISSRFQMGIQKLVKHLRQKV